MIKYNKAICNIINIIKYNKTICNIISGWKTIAKVYPKIG